MLARNAARRSSFPNGRNTSTAAGCATSGNARPADTGSRRSCASPNNGPTTSRSWEPPVFRRLFLGKKRARFMDKQVIKAGVPETAGPFNLCVRYGNLIFISGLPPFEEDYAQRLREARAKGEPIP